MPRLIRAYAVSLVFILAGCAGSSTTQLNYGGDGNYKLSKQIRYSFTLSNTTDRLLAKAQFWTYLPVPNTSHQRVKKIAANYPYQEKRDELGNSTINFELENIPPYGSRIVSITVDLLMSAQPVAMSVGDRQRFLSPEPYIETGDARIVELAAQLHNESPAVTIQNDYEWVEKNIVSENYIAEDRGAVSAIETRTGDCTEFSYLLTALYRVQQIPARAIGGYVFSNNGIVKAMDYHNWTEFYFDGAWQIADAQKGFFVSKQTDYVAMRVISTGGAERVASQRFSYAGEGLRVEMN